MKSMKVLIVEDDFVIADDLARVFEKAGVQVLGPVASVVDAIPLIDQAEVAVLNVDVQGKSALPLAERLIEKQVVVVFYSGHDPAVLPDRMRQVRFVPKPATSDVVLNVLSEIAG
jgi:two-component SAPR family response regulator